jgi:hypothetical protein
MVRFKKCIGHKICVLIFPLALCVSRSEVFVRFDVHRYSWDAVIHLRTSPYKAIAILFRSESKFKFSRQILGNILKNSQTFSNILKHSQTSGYIKIRPLRAELFPADRRTDRHDEDNSRFCQLEKPVVATCPINPPAGFIFHVYKDHTLT